MISNVFFSVNTIKRKSLKERVAAQTSQNSPRKDWLITVPGGELWPCDLPQVANPSHSRRVEGRLTWNSLLEEVPPGDPDPRKAKPLIIKNPKNMAA